MSDIPMFPVGGLVAVPLVLPMAGAIACFTHSGLVECGCQLPADSVLNRLDAEQSLLMSEGLRP